MIYSVNEGQQAEEYKARKAKESEENDVLSNPQHVRRFTAKYGEFPSDKYDNSPGTKRVEKEINRRMDKVFDDMNDHNMKSYTNAIKYSTHAADAANRHIRRHPEQYKEGTIFESVKFIGESANKDKQVNIDIWGRSFGINIVYDKYEGEDILDIQIKACDLFLKNSTKLLDGVKEKVIKYCIKESNGEISENNIDNIFRFVKPRSLYIRRNNSNVRHVALLCDYMFNPDDGIAIVFKNEKFSAIGTSDIIL